MVYDEQRNQIDLVTTPDEIHIDLEGFNRKVITEPFNRVVCDYLAQELDPFARQKTLIFCLTDRHADLVVNLLRQAFSARYPDFQEEAVAKITGTADRPLELIRRYKNELNLTVAVTVDLLTTGIDVPEICTLVFLRRVNSRILFVLFEGQRRATDSRRLDGQVQPAHDPAPADGHLLCAGGQDQRALFHARRDGEGQYAGGVGL